MSCNHGFIDELNIEIKNLDYLFIGTFNPKWESDNGNNAEYFYGRGTNLFWCIMPHSFNEPCLIDKGKAEWKKFCRYESRKIGITDIISKIPNADCNNDIHKKLIMSYQDESLEIKKDGQYVFDLTWNTQSIIRTIQSNSWTLKGVFFTRSIQNKIMRIWNNWKVIEDCCKTLNQTQNSKIYTQALLSPSSKAKRTIKEKISHWKMAINHSINY